MTAEHVHVFTVEIDYVSAADRVYSLRTMVSCKIEIA